MRRILTVIFGSLPILVFYVVFKMPTHGNVDFPVRRGESFRVTVSRLKRSKIIHDTLRFLILARITGLDKKSKSGYYTFRQNLPEFKVLLKLTVEGAPLKEFRIRIPEGYTIRKMAPLFRRIGIDPDSFIYYTQDSLFIEKVRRCCPIMDHPSTLEGYLYPDTYNFVYGESIYDVVCRMLKRMCSVFDSTLIKRMQDIDFDLHKTLTLASIIEKEAMVDGERPIISGVFHNRLKRGIPLASNPTLNYALGINYGWLPSWAIREQTPYNTYIYPGLPPGPICSPSKKSIIAALWPKRVPYLYFVAKGDGTHLFARTYAQHQRNIRYVKYLLFKKRNLNTSSGVVKNAEKVNNESKPYHNQQSVQDTMRNNIHKNSNKNPNKSD